jgi:hypothetical protein
MVPPGGGLADVVSVLTEAGKLSAVMRSASEWVAGAIVVMRSASEPNPWRNATDEEIAGELLRAIEERKAGKRKADRSAP